MHMCHCKPTPPSFRLPHALLLLLALPLCADAIAHQAVGDEPVVSAALLSRASRQDSFASGSAGGDPLKELLERFNSIDSLAEARGGAEALFVLQVGWRWGSCRAPSALLPVTQPAHASCC